MRPLGLNRRQHTLELPFLSEDADSRRERSNGVRIRDVNLPRRSTHAVVQNRSSPDGRDDAEPKQQVLYLTRQPFGDGRKAKLRLARSQNGGPSISCEQPVQKNRDRALRTAKYDIRNKLESSGLAPDPKGLEPQSEGILRVVARGLRSSTKQLMLGNAQRGREPD